MSSSSHCNLYQIDELTYVFAVFGNVWSNLWMCPPPNYETALWWCGNNSQETPCQTTSKVIGTLQGYTSGSILGIATSTISEATATSIHSSAISTSASASPSTNVCPSAYASATVTTTSSAEPVHSSHETNWTPFAIAISIGVPLGLALIGLLSFLLWKLLLNSRTPTETYKATSKLHQALERSHGRSYQIEVPDSQIPWELDHGNGKSELPHK